MKYVFRLRTTPHEIHVNVYKDTPFEQIRERAVREWQELYDPRYNTGPSQVRPEDLILIQPRRKD